MTLQPISMTLLIHKDGLTNPLSYQTLQCSLMKRTLPGKSERQRSRTNWKLMQTTIQLPCLRLPMLQAGLRVALLNTFMQDITMKSLSHMPLWMNFWNTLQASMKIRMWNSQCETHTKTSAWKSLSHSQSFTSTLSESPVFFHMMNPLWWMTWRIGWFNDFRMLWLSVKLNLKIWPLSRHICNTLTRLNTHCSFNDRVIERNLPPLPARVRTQKTPSRLLSLWLLLQLCLWLLQ